MKRVYYNYIIYEHVLYDQYCRGGINLQLVLEVFSKVSPLLLRLV